MDWKRIAPWNWFKDEDDESAAGQDIRSMEPSSDPVHSLRTELERLFGDTARPGRIPGLLRPRVDSRHQR